MKNIKGTTITLEDLPEDMKAQVRKELITKHVLGVSVFGSKHFKRMERDKLNITEKILVAYYAFEAAIGREDYNILAELAGYCLYGFIESGAYIPAENFIHKMTDPDTGGSLDVVLSLWLNLRHLKSKYTKSVESDALDKSEQIKRLTAELLEGFDNNLEGLWAMNKLQEKRTQDLKSKLELKLLGIGVTVVLTIYLVLKFI